MNKLWDNDPLQFARLIFEIQAAGGFTDSLVETLCSEMDLSKQEIFEIVERATLSFENSKKAILKSK